MKLSGMDYEIRYKSSSSNNAVDALSRRGQVGLNVLTTTATAPELIEEVKNSWAIPGGYSRIIEVLKAGQDCKHFSLDQGLLRRKGKCVIGPSVELRRKLLGLYHNGVLGEYSEAHATNRKVSSVFYWPKLEKDVRK